MNAYGFELNPFMPPHRMDTDQVNREQWEAIAEARRLFIEEDIVPESGGWLQSEVIESWKRCKAHGIDPDAANLATSLPEETLESIAGTYAELVEAARPLIGLIDDFNLTNDYIFELISREGVTVLRTGNMDLHSIIVRNSAMNEETMGTNAHTLSMHNATPVQLLGPEHYCSALHGLAALASPVFDKDGTVAGSMLLTQPLPEEPWSSEYQRLLSHALGFITSICSALEHQMVFQKSLAVIADVDQRLEAATAYGARTRHVLEAAIGSSDDPLLVVDASGIVQHASPEAIHLMRTTQSDVINKPIEAVLGIEWPEGYQPLIERSGVELTTEVGNQILGLRGNVVRNAGNDDFDGLIIRISEVKEPPQRSKGRSGEVASIRFEDILGTSAAIREAIALAHRYALTSENILIIGESGTGKEFFAQAIHNASRPDGPFMSVNCAAIPPRLIESELFGYESGAFTGADKAGKPGKIELADKGTLFLDEIGDMPLELQATILRVLENKSVMRLGGKSYRQVDFRVVAATNRSLTKMVESGKFREDLLYRLSILTVGLPPLRMRNGDILFFAYYFLNECRRKSHEGPTRFTAAVEKLLAEYPWPGNVRQIKNAIFSAFYAAVSDEIDIPDLPRYLRDGTVAPFEDFEGLSLSARYTSNGVKIEDHMDEVSAQERSRVREVSKAEEAPIVFPSEMLSMESIEGAAIRLALTYAQGNVTQAAEMLQISKATLYRKIKEYKLK